MAPQDAQAGCARRPALVIDQEQYVAALRLYAQIHDIVSDVIEDGGVITKQKLGPERYCKLVRLLGDVGAMWKEHRT